MACDKPRERSSNLQLESFLSSARLAILVVAKNPMVLIAVGVQRYRDDQPNRIRHLPCSLATAKAQREASSWGIVANSTDAGAGERHRRVLPDVGVGIVSYRPHVVTLTEDELLRRMNEGLYKTDDLVRGLHDGRSRMLRILLRPILMHDERVQKK